MTEVGARDRWIMAGLVTLGLFTVIAGVLSGRSTIDYVLGRDAREAALAWSGKIDAQLRSPQGDAADSVTPDIQVLNAAALDELAAGAQEAITLPARPSFSGDGFALIDGFNRLTRGWVLSNLDEKSGEFVSQMDGFAVLTPTGQALAVGGGLSPDALSGILESGAVTMPSNLPIFPAKTICVWPSCPSRKTARSRASMHSPSTRRPPLRSPVWRSLWRR